MIRRAILALLAAALLSACVPRPAPPPPPKCPDPLIDWPAYMRCQRERHS